MFESGEENDAGNDEGWVWEFADADKNDAGAEGSDERSESK